MQTGDLRTRIKPASLIGGDIEPQLAAHSQHRPVLAQPIDTAAVYREAIRRQLTG